MEDQVKKLLLLFFEKIGVYDPYLDTLDISHFYDGFVYSLKFRIRDHDINVRAIEMGDHDWKIFAQYDDQLVCDHFDIMVIRAFDELVGSIESIGDMMEVAALGN